MEIGCLNVRRTRRVYISSLVFEPRVELEDSLYEGSRGGSLMQGVQMLDLV
jgi:hypothetical protein